ncbi:hypothetical protein [Saccharophagus degradans]|uniref:Chromosome segregation protein SMC n=1 Tax=Saccharophagus degradans TaxID=86304 RepID=A0AAW7X5T6_9GAMM|nr:hypothetical protein [Saccharophagus degradans]MDO6423063.1 hypothetical protein [Saccharophagus degradans]MDO6607413.1 hypothetical protein [Saccharophagus degradans]
MKTSLELFKNEVVISPPKDLTEPRFWVRRLVIWDKVGGKVIRDIPLKPGLNVVWTPDEDGIGHGGGKSLFCRLLRYCLGESSYSTEEQRELVVEKLPDAIVGAEVIINKSVWSVVRPLGVRRRHLALEGVDLEELAESDQASTGIEPLLDTIESAFLSEGISDLISPRRKDHSNWLVALAWLSRDQECRFDHPLDWRSAATETDSPARGMTMTDRFDGVRSFLRAISVEEKQLRNSIAELDDEKKSLDRELSHRRWEIKKLKTHLVDVLGINPAELMEGSLGYSVLKAVAEKHLNAIQAPSTNKGPSHLQTERITLSTIQSKYEKAKADLQSVEAEIPLLKNLIKVIDSAYPGLQVRAHGAKTYACPICEVPIDQALAEGCKLSHKIPNLDDCKKRLDQNREELAEQKQKLSNAETLQASLTTGLSEITASLEKQKQKVTALEQQAEAEKEPWYKAKRNVDDANNLVSLAEKESSLTGQLEEKAARSESLKESLRKQINAQEKVLSSLSERFDAMTKFVLGQEAHGGVSFTSNSLRLSIQLGGNRTTSAIDSLKVVLFDLAVLSLCVEEKANIPAFWIHDSPREADLGLSIYHRLFDLVCELGIKQPCYQYVVTTTTKPPEKYAVEPWLSLQLRGNPAEERLLRINL